MTGICDGRVVIVTGAGRGLGRAHALEFARQGARVVVNDVGAELDGTGSSSGPAGEVVDQIRAMGGEAIANGDDISDETGSKHLIDAAIEQWGTLDVIVNNAGILRDRMIFNMDVAGLRCRHPRAPARHLADEPPRRGLLARQVQRRHAGGRPHYQHDVARRSVHQHGPDQLRTRQSRHREHDDHPGRGNWAATA